MFIPKDKLTMPPESFTNLTFTSAPLGFSTGGWLQGSIVVAPTSPDEATVAGDIVGRNVAVGIGVSVGGKGVDVAVAVGIAA